MDPGSDTAGVHYTLLSATGGVMGTYSCAIPRSLGSGFGFSLVHGPDEIDLMINSLSTLPQLRRDRAANYHGLDEAFEQSSGTAVATRRDRWNARRCLCGWRKISTPKRGGSLIKITTGPRAPLPGWWFAKSTTFRSATGGSFGNQWAFYTETGLTRRQWPAAATVHLPTACNTFTWPRAA